MNVERLVGGAAHVCKPLDAGTALRLFLRTSREINGAEGFLRELYVDGDAIGLMREWFEFARTYDEEELHTLIVELASLTQRADGSPSAPSDMYDLLELASFAVGVYFGHLLPLEISGLFTRAEPIFEKNRAV